ncbi:hypothetical protein EJ110_NYTH02640 [Nymphaea thermarum]|nr:hypothetical protein EJ110_NYTH02640 [Nymphaea thermarum]
MERHTYMTLCNTLRTRNLLEDARDISVEEQVAIFILTIGHNERNRAAQNTFQHSGQTISKYASLVLRAIWIMSGGPMIRCQYIFGDLNGSFHIFSTHVPAWVPASDQARFRNRKAFISQNVMV